MRMNRNWVLFPGNETDMLRLPMNSTTLGNSDLNVSRLAYGCMRIAGTWNPAEITPERREAAFGSLAAAYEAGYTLFDHADIYCRGGCEQLHGDYLKGEKPTMNSWIALRCLTTACLTAAVMLAPRPAAALDELYRGMSHPGYMSCLGRFHGA